MSPARSTSARDKVMSRLNLLTRSGVSLLRNLPFGGAVGVVVSGVVLWFAPGLVPEGWTAEAVLSLGMGSGMVLERLVDGLLGWFLDPIRRHLRSGWEAEIQLRKLGRYSRRGLLDKKLGGELTDRIVKADVTARKRT